MTFPAAFVLFALADPPPPSLGAHAPALQLSQPAIARSPDAMDLGLRSTVFGFDGRDLARRRWLAQAGTRAADATPPPSTDGGGGQCEIGCEECREYDQQARDVLRRRRHMLTTHRAFAIGTWSALLVTEVLGTISAINQDTWFGTGACASGRPDDAVFGSYGCGGLRSLHLTFAFITTGLYITSGVLALAAPDPERASASGDGAARRLRVHKALSWVHATGMILMPLLGILASNPEIVMGSGADGASSRQDFSRAMRSVHEIVGYTTFAAFSTAAFFEIF